jgi:hypothetical protein
MGEDKLVKGIISPASGYHFFFLASTVGVTHTRVIITLKSESSENIIHITLLCMHHTYAYICAANVPIV